VNSLYVLIGAIRRALHKVPSLQYVYCKWFVRCLPNRDLVVPWDGQQIMVRNPRQSLIGRELLVNGIWEAEVTNFICGRVSRDMTVIDVGADIGYYTLLFARRVGKEGRVIAFEPIPEAKERLEDNVGLNGYANVTICDFALFSSEGQVVLEGPLQLSRINLFKSNTENKDIRVMTRVFDQVVPEFELHRIDLVKIDVEGAELDVLRGMEGSLKMYHPHLLIEVHPDYLSHFDCGPEDLLGFLHAMKYTIQAVDKGTVTFSQGNITIYCT